MRNFCRVIVLCAMASAAVGEMPLPSAPVVAVDSLVQEALESHPELKRLEAEIDAARAGGKIVAQRSNPELHGDVGWKTVDGSGSRDEGVAWSASFVQSFEWPGRTGLRRAVANGDIELAELGLASFRAALAGRVRALAYTLLAANEKAAVADEVANRFKSLREVLAQRDPAGLTSVLELRIIEATELTMQRKAREAALSAKAARLDLNLLRGAEPHDEFSVANTPMEFQLLEDDDALWAAARTNNFELRVRSVELTQQGVRADLAQNERYPAISVGPAISEERAGDHERLISVGVSVPLPLSNRSAGHVETAAARKRQAEASLAMTERDIERQIREAALIYRTSLREMAAWRSDAVEHLREAADLADRHYRLGAVPMGTYVELQRQYLEAVEAVLETRKEALDAAVRLEWLTGLTLLPAGSMEGEGK